MIDGWGEAENSRENLKSPVKVHYYPVGGISFRLCNSVNKYVVYHTHATELRQTLVNNRRLFDIESPTDIRFKVFEAEFCPQEAAAHSVHE
jgi:hypothetical protein